MTGPPVKPFKWRASRQKKKRADAVPELPPARDEDPDAEHRMDADRAQEDFKYFATHIFADPTKNPFDDAFHGILMELVMHGESKELPVGDYFFPTRADLERAQKVGFFVDEFRLSDIHIDAELQLPKLAVFDRLRSEPTNLDGSWRGIFVRITPSLICDLRLYLLPRGHLKTTLLTQARKLWLIVRRPAEEHLIAMQSGLNAKNLVSELKGHFERNPRFRATFPELIPRNLKSNEVARGRTRDGLRWQATNFDVPIPGEDKARREPCVVGAGITSRVVSTHYRNIDYDDIVDDLNSRTKEGLQMVIQRFLSFESLGVGDMTKKTYVGTPWHYGDCSQWALNADESGYHWMTCCVATCMDPDGNPMYPKPEGSRWHPGFTKKRLQRLQRRQKALFNPLYLMQPVGADAKAFDPDWWRWYKQIPATVRYATVMAVDPAISERVQGDYTAFAVVSIDQFGNWWVRAVTRGRGLGVPGIVDEVYRLYNRYKPDVVGIEGVGFQKTLLHVLQDQWQHKGRTPIPVTSVTESRDTSKEWRIGRIVDRVKRGQILLPAPLVDKPLETRHQRVGCDEGLEALINEGERFPLGAHDDVLDALSMVMDINYAPPKVRRSESRKKALKAKRGLFSRADRPPGEESYDEVLGIEF